MTTSGLQQMEYTIARCRLVLSIAGLVAVYIDPAEPLVSHWIPWVSGPFTMDYRLLTVMVLHLAYSLAVYASLWRERWPAERVAAYTMWLDVLFGAAIGTLTEGATSPAYAFFAFAVVAAGLRAGLRQALWVTAASVGLYECLLLLSTRGGADVYLMRPAYLAITGYLVGFLGQQRLELQDEMRQLEATEQRHRIARDLHDNFAQALGGINLRLEGYRRELRITPVRTCSPTSRSCRTASSASSTSCAATRARSPESRSRQHDSSGGRDASSRARRVDGISGPRGAHPADCSRRDQQRTTPRPGPQRHDRDSNR
jgi:hypothetical protein